MFCKPIVVSLAPKILRARGPSKAGDGPQCDVGGVHYHILDGGAQLTHNLDLKEPKLAIPYECRTRLVQQIMPESLDVETEVGLMPWNCSKCS